MQYVEIMKISLESKQILVSPMAWQVGSEAILLRGAWYQRWPWLLQSLEVPTAALDPSAFGALLCFSSNQFHPPLNLLLWLQYPSRQKESLT